MTKARVLDFPLVLTPAGQLLCGATDVVPEIDDPYEILRQALGTGRPVHMSILLDDDEVAEVRERLDECLREVVAIAYRERG